MSDDLKEWGEELKRVREDTSMKMATVRKVETVRLYSDPDEDAQLHLRVFYRTTGGREFKEDYPLPDSWDIEEEAVALCRLWGLDPENITLLNSDERDFEVPVDLQGEPSVDFDRIYRLLDPQMDEKTGLAYREDEDGE